MVKRSGINQYFCLEIINSTSIVIYIDLLSKNIVHHSYEQSQFESEVIHKVVTTLFQSSGTSYSLPSHLKKKNPKIATYLTQRGNDLTFQKQKKSMFLNIINSLIDHLPSVLCDLIFDYYFSVAEDYIDFSNDCIDF